MSGKKGMYHSELVKLSPVTALIMSEPTESKFPDHPRWVALEINGEERFLSCENVSIELALAGMKGQWAQLTALGRGEDAVIQIEDPVAIANQIKEPTPFAKAKAVMQAPVVAPQPPPARQSFNQLDERQRAIIRQHSQSMAIEVLKLKQALNELSVDDLTPAKLRALANYFDTDVLDKPNA